MAKTAAKVDTVEFAKDYGFEVIGKSLNFTLGAIQKFLKGLIQAVKERFAIRKAA
jgi:hypothetical protein